MYESPVSKQRRNGLLADRAVYALETLTCMSKEAAGRIANAGRIAGVRSTEQSVGLSNPGFRQKGGTMNVSLEQVKELAATGRYRRIPIVR